MLLNCGVEEDSWESLGLQGVPNSPSSRKSVLNIHWKDWWWSGNSNPLATWCEELTQLKRPWCWERLNPGGEEDDRGWDVWVASQTQWPWVWLNCRSWWGLACCSPWGRKELDTAEQLNWPELMAQQVKNPPAMQETWVRSLGWKDPLEEGKATHSSVLPWRIPWTVQSTGSQRVGHEWVTFTQCHMMLYFDLQTSDCITYVDTKWLSRA